jgi:Fatty acid desaturase
VTQTQAPQPKRFRFSSPLRALISHLRFGSQNAAFLLILTGLLLGGAWIWVTFLVLVAIIYGGNTILPYDLTEPENPPRALHDFFLRAGLPLMLTNAVLLTHYFTDSDPFHIVAGLQHIGIDLNAAREGSSALDKTIAVIAIGILWGFGQAAAHELTHRINSKFDLSLSRWISALALDPANYLHHPYSHHRLVGLVSDPQTARRGENLYAFTRRSFVESYGYAMRAEAARMKRQNRHWFSFENRFLKAWAIDLFYVAVAWAIGGLPSALGFLAAAGVAHLMVEGITYVQHYGLLRLENERIDERISWDVYGAMASALTYNVGRHSDHHLHPLRHCADLKVSPGAPNLPYNYSALVAMALIPSIYRRKIQPYLDNWDRNFATPAELAFMRKHNIPHAKPENPRRESHARTTHLTTA